MNERTAVSTKLLVNAVQTQVTGAACRYSVHTTGVDNHVDNYYGDGVIQ